jgi:hypothetical protein
MVSGLAARGEPERLLAELAPNDAFQNDAKSDPGEAPILPALAHRCRAIELVV